MNLLQIRRGGFHVVLTTLMAGAGENIEQVWINILYFSLDPIFLRDPYMS